MQPVLTAIWLFNVKTCTLLHNKVSASGGNGYVQSHKSNRCLKTCVYCFNNTDGRNHTRPKLGHLEAELRTSDALPVISMSFREKTQEGQH